MTSDDVRFSGDLMLFGRRITDESIALANEHMILAQENRRLRIVFCAQEQAIMMMPKHIPVIRKKVTSTTTKRLYPLDPKYAGPSLRKRK